MRQDKIMVDVVQRQLLAQAVLALTQRGDAPPNGCHMLAQAEVDALHKGGVDLPTAGRQHLLDRLQRAEHDAVLHVDQAPAPHGLDHLRIEQLRAAASSAAWALDLGPGGVAGAPSTHSA